MLQEALQRSEQNIADHELYLEKYNAAMKWISIAEGEFARVRNDAVSQEELERGQAVVKVRI